MVVVICVSFYLNRADWEYMLHMTVVVAVQSKGGDVTKVKCISECRVRRNDIITDTGIASTRTICKPQSTNDFQ
jgi:hypothetical protein